MIEKVKRALESILAKFESGEIPEAIAYSTFPIDFGLGSSILRGNP